MVTLKISLCDPVWAHKNILILSVVIKPSCYWTLQHWPVSHSTKSDTPAITVGYLFIHSLIYSLFYFSMKNLKSIVPKTKKKIQINYMQRHYKPSFLLNLFHLYTFGWKPKSTLLNIFWFGHIKPHIKKAFKKIKKKKNKINSRQYRLHVRKAFFLEVLCRSVAWGGSSSFHKIIFSLLMWTNFSVKILTLTPHTDLTPPPSSNEDTLMRAWFSGITA